MLESNFQHLIKFGRSRKYSFSLCKEIALFIRRKIALDYVFKFNECSDANWAVELEIRLGIQWTEVYTF